MYLASTKRNTSKVTLDTIRKSIDEKDSFCLLISANQKKAF